MLSLQHDTGRYAGEYTYSVQDGMVGLKGLWNFGWKGMAGMAGRVNTRAEDLEKMRAKGVDEEEMMEGGLKGRFSAGGEVYFSAKQRSFGGTSQRRKPRGQVLMGSIDRCPILYSSPTQQLISLPPTQPPNYTHTFIQPPHGIPIHSLLGANITHYRPVIPLWRERLLVRERSEYRW